MIQIALKVGDVVRLKGGSHDMTVREISWRRKTAFCNFFRKEKLMFAEYAIKRLIKVR